MSELWVNSGGEWPPDPWRRHWASRNRKPRKNQPDPLSLWIQFRLQGALQGPPTTTPEGDQPQGGGRGRHGVGVGEAGDNENSSGRVAGVWLGSGMQSKFTHHLIFIFPSWLKG